MQNQTFAYISQYLSHHPYLGICFAFLVSFLESLAIIGSIVPGSVTLTAVGVLIGTGIIATMPTLTAAIIGAFIGDSLSFWLGKKYSTSLQEKWPFTAYPKLISEGEAFFNKYGNLSIFIGRFVGPIRCILPVSAGILNMSTVKFVVADLLSAIVWAPAYLMPGILIGATSLELEADTGPRLLVAVFVLLISAWLIKLISQWLLAMYQKQLLRLSYFISDYYPKTFQHFYRDHLIRCRTFHLIVSIILLTFLLSFLQSGMLITFNESAWHLFQSFRFLNLTPALVFFTFFAEKSVVILAGIVLGLFWIYKKQRRLSLGWLLTAFFALAIALMTKHFLGIERPTGLVFTRETYSFPSGHSTVITMLLTYFYLTMSHHLKRGTKNMLLKLSGLMIALQLLTRLYLGAHWPSDIFGGFLIGFICATFFSAIYIPKDQDYTLAKQSLVVLLTAWIILTLGYTSLKYSEQYGRYQIKPLPIKAIEHDAWWQQTSPILPTARLNYIGEADVPFNLQWHASAAHIQQTLEKNGWKSIKPYDWINFINRLAHYGNKQHLPLFPKQYHFELAEMTFIKHVRKDTPALIIRLWKAPLVLLPKHDKPLYIGSIHYRYRWSIKPHKHLAPFPYPLIAKALEPILSEYQWQKISYPIKIKHSLEVDDPNEVYLID